MTEVIHQLRGTECMPWPIPYQGELVGDSPLWGQLCPKTIGWEELVTVVVLDDLSHCLEGHGIGAKLVGTHVVQRGRLQGIPCRETEALTSHSLAYRLCIYPTIHLPTSTGTLSSFCLLTLLETLPCSPMSFMLYYMVTHYHTPSSPPARRQIQFQSVYSLLSSDLCILWFIYAFCLLSCHISSFLS